ncbi:MAG TPA: porin [Chryseosolibacter sp.]|nr:porin [Chryseosolibacter sp.]
MSAPKNPMHIAARLVLFCAVLALSGTVVNAQERLPLDFFFKKGRGFGLVTRDSLFSLNFQFRMQNRATYVTKSEDDLDPDSFEFRVRRLRFKFEGFVYDPKLTYYIQLSVSRGDMDWRVTDLGVINSSPNIVRDAIIYYSPKKRVRFGFGQTKLPGNRQRVVSSGDQQFVDRSIVNATFNIDRDFGFFAQYSGDYFNLRGALTSGEGRNALPESRSPSNQGLAYTGRIELLPFGRFTGNNDYIEGDLEREPKPKLSIAATYSFNDQAVRTAGQLGNDLFQSRGIRNFSADVVFKYSGLAFYNEFMQRDVDDAITVNPTNPSSTRYIYVGQGYLSQLSYLFKNNLEVAARWSRVTPFSQIEDREDQVQQVEFGVTRYFVGHRLKVQGNILHQTRDDLSTSSYAGGSWAALFQVELGI